MGAKATQAKYPVNVQKKRYGFQNVSGVYTLYELTGNRYVFLNLSNPELGYGLNGGSYARDCNFFQSAEEAIQGAKDAGFFVVGFDDGLSYLRWLQDCLQRVDYDYVGR